MADLLEVPLIQKELFEECSKFLAAVELGSGAGPAPERSSQHGTRFSFPVGPPPADPESKFHGWAFHPPGPAFFTWCSQFPHPLRHLTPRILTCGQLGAANFTH